MIMASKFPIETLAPRPAAAVDPAHQRRRRSSGAGRGRRYADVVVTNASGIHGVLVADYVLGVLVMLQWRFPELLRRQQAREWRFQFTAPLAGKTLGVVGLGSIGAEVARRASRLRHAGDRTPAPIRRRSTA